MPKQNVRSKTAAAKAKRSGGLDLLRISLFGRELPLYWTWIALGSLLFVTHLMVKLEVKSATYEFLDAFSWVGPGQFRNADYSFGGTLEATEIAIVPSESEADDRPISIGRIVVETPGPIWLLRASLPSFSPQASGTLGKLQKAADKIGGSDETPNVYPPTDELRIRFEDIDWSNFGLAWVLPEIDWIGGTSGALFEAAGCSNDWWWTREEVRERFGAPDADGRIDVHLKVTGPNTLANRIELGHGGNSSVVIEREFLLPGEADDFLDSDPDTWRTTKVRWTVADTGFVRARNRWCANEAKIAEAAFVERHVAAVQRELESIGLAPTPQLLDAYRVYARNGGTLVWETNLAPGKALEDSDGHGAEAALLAMNARVTVAGRPPVPYVGTIIQPREYPEDAASIVAVLEKEGRLPTAGASAGATMSTEAVATAASAVPDAKPGAAPATETVAGTTSATPAAVAVAPAAPAAAAANPGEMAAITTLFAEAPADADAEPAPSKIPSGPFAVAELPQRVGHTVRLTLANGRKYVGVIERVDARTVSIKVGVRGGSASLSFVRDTIASVEALGW